MTGKLGINKSIHMVCRSSFDDLLVATGISHARKCSLSLLKIFSLLQESRTTGIPQHIANDDKTKTGYFNKQSSFI